MPLPTTEKMLTQVRKFVRNPTLIISSEAAERISGVPDAWVRVLSQQEQGENGWIDLWQPYQDLLPGVYDFLQYQVHGVCLLQEEHSPLSLLYLYSAGSADYFYRGYPALGSPPPQDRDALWKHLPPRLQEFYLTLHDGWTELSSDALGPLPLADMELLSDQDWEMEPGQAETLPFRLDQVLTVFRNGGGDLLGLDFGSGAPEDHALAWWHEEPLAPDVNQNFWALMDGWISGQLEDVDRLPAPLPRRAT